MIVLCPAAPTVRSDLDVALAELKTGSELIRFHSPDYTGNAFNPNTRRKMEDAAAGARFSPFPDPRGVNVPTTYAGSTRLASALESVFHDVPHTPNPPYPASKLPYFVLSRLRVRRPLKILELVNPQLRQVAIPGREESLAELEIIHTKAAEYPTTRAWARYLHHSLPHLEGLAWRPRLGGKGLAYVFFGDRVAATDFDLVESATRIDTGPGRKLIEALAGEAHIKIVEVG
jgi:hypothetical protein